MAASLCTWGQSAHHLPGDCKEGINHAHRPNIKLLQSYLPSQVLSPVVHFCNANLQLRLRVLFPQASLLNLDLVGLLLCLSFHLSVYLSILLSHIYRIYVFLFNQTLLNHPYLCWMFPLLAEHNATWSPSWKFCFLGSSLRMWLLVCISGPGSRIEYLFFFHSASRHYVCMCKEGGGFLRLPLA